MKIELNKIGKEPVGFKASYDVDIFNIDTAIARIKKPVVATLTASKDKENLLVKAYLDYVVGFMCSRCLLEFDRGFKKDFSFSVVVGNEQTVDVTQNLREEVLLDLPIKPLCKPDCKGLCPVCGRDLNEKECGCK